MSRRRTKLVPDGGVEIMEIRIALYFAADGARLVATNVSSPDDPDLAEVDMVELEGAISRGLLKLREDYTSDAA